jgi:hypothetical protein
MPAIIGTAGVKSYGWAPKGFEQDNALFGHYGQPVVYFFVPAYFFDIRLWHKAAWYDGENYHEF